MDTLTFLSIKSIADNLDIKQTSDLIQLLNARLNKMKTNVIKEKLREKFDKYDDTKKYLPLIDKIDMIGTCGNELVIEFNDNPRYQLAIDESGTLSFADKKEGSKKWVYGWKQGLVMYELLDGFGKFFSDSIGEDGGIDQAFISLEEDIKDYLICKDLNGKELYL